MLALRNSNLPSIKEFLSALLLGVDIGGTKLALVVGDVTGSVLSRRQLPMALSGDPRADVAHLATQAHRLLRDTGVPPEDVACVGLCAPGPIDRAAGRVCNPPNLPGWRDVPLVRQVREVLRCPVHLENDANAAALAEWRFGAGRGCSDMVYLTMSTGVGGGLILDGRLHRGQTDKAAELGHLPVEWDGEPCACGMRGCLEAYVGGAAWTRWLRGNAPADSRAAQLAGGPDRVSPEHALRAAEQGDAFARAALDRFNRYLARGIAAIAFALAPERVVLGTIPSAAGETLCFEPLRRLVGECVWPDIGAGLQILPSALGEEQPYRAALCAALEGLAARAH
jgi:glucokinase